MFHVKHLLLFLPLIISCKQDPAPTWIQIVDDRILEIIDTTERIETIASGFQWSEGPVWSEQLEALLFSDVPTNTIYIWKNDSLSEWLTPSGYTGPEDKVREGSNGLAINSDGELILCQHGDRRVARLDTSLSSPIPAFSTIANKWRGLRFNSPNDLAFSDGNIYFTDPPYGLPGQDQDPDKEIGFSGIYRINKDGLVILIDNALSRPNGIAFSPNQKFMYISNSDPENAIWVKYEMNDHHIVKKSVLYDATKFTSSSPGLPDGLKVHPSGYIFATGPGGIWVFSPDNQLVAKLKIEQATSNCAFNADYSQLFITADSLILRLQLKEYPPAH